MADVKILSFDLDGIPRMLSGMEEIEAAYAAGQIGPDTDVTVYFDDNSRNFAPAGKQDALRQLFAPQAVDEPEAEAEQEPPASIPTNTQDKPDVGAEREEPAETTEQEPPAPQQAFAEPLQSDIRVSDGIDPASANGLELDPNARNGLIAVGVIILVAFAGFALFSDDGAEDEFATEAIADSGFEMEEAAEVMEDGAEDIVEPVGPLDSGTAGEFRMLRASSLLLRPDGIANGTIPIGQKVFVDGTVDGYAQLTTDDGEFGYAAWEDINGNPYLDRTYRIQVVNNCSVNKSFLLIWRENGDWQIDGSNILSIPGNRSWVLAAGSGMSQRELEVDTLEIYYYPIGDNVQRARSFYPDSRKSVKIDGRSDEMLTAIPELSDDGLATITFGPPQC